MEISKFAQNRRGDMLVSAHILHRNTHYIYIFAAEVASFKPLPKGGLMECVCALFRTSSEYKLELFNSFNVNITLGRHVVDVGKTPTSWRKQIALDVM